MASLPPPEPGEQRLCPPSWFLHPFILALTHSPTHSLTHSSTRLLTHLLTPASSTCLGHEGLPVSVLCAQQVPPGQLGGLRCAPPCSLCHQRAGPMTG